MEGKVGIVIAQQDGKVKIRLIEAEGGASCGLGEGCCLRGGRGSCDLKRMFAFFEGSSHVTDVEALNEANARVGQRCWIELKGDHRALVKGSLACYLIPALAFLIGLALGNAWGVRFAWDGDRLILAQLGGGLLGLGLAFLGARLYGRARQADTFMPVVTRVLGKASEQEAQAGKISQEAAR